MVGCGPGFFLAGQVPRAVGAVGWAARGRHCWRVAFIVAFACHMGRLVGCIGAFTCPSGTCLQHFSARFAARFGSVRHFPFRSFGRVVVLGCRGLLLGLSFPFLSLLLAVRPITNGSPLGVRAAPQLSFSLESFGRGVRWRCSASFLGHCCVVRCSFWLFGLVCRGLVLVCFIWVGVSGLVGFLFWVRQVVVSRLSALWSRVGCLCEASWGLVSLSLGLPGPPVGVCYVMLCYVTPYC